ncbi:hypothetical protein [Kribbella sp. NPDC000426]|uniref:hypothetical protein n=1 Tax=Kribbella sp. NPDC000426 TaxID=3154255 RepID=UPI0033295BC4
MPRKERQLDPADGPVADFAIQLRRVRSKAGMNYRAMAEETHFSHAHLARCRRRAAAELGGGARLSDGAGGTAAAPFGSCRT